MSKYTFDKLKSFKETNLPDYFPEEIIEQYANKEISERKLRTILTLEEQKHFASLITAAEKKRSTVIITDRNLQVIFITGPSGSGKSNTLARYICEKMGYDYSIGAAGDHMVETYKDTEAFIIDDFRGQMRVQELSNFLDNMMNVEANARYHNIDFSNCKLVIITSILAPDKIYKSEEIMDEPIFQFYRRLYNKSYIRIFSMNPDGTMNLKKAAKPISDGYYAWFRCEDNSLIQEYGVNSMKEPYDTVFKDNEIKDIASILGFNSIGG